MARGEERERWSSVPRKLFILLHASHPSPPSLPPPPLPSSPLTSVTPFFSLPLQSSLAQLGIPFTDVVKVLVAILLLGNMLFYEAKNQELSLQGTDGE